MNKEFNFDGKENEVNFTVGDYTKSGKPQEIYFKPFKGDRSKYVIGLKDLKRLVKSLSKEFGINF